MVGSAARKNSRGGYTRYFTISRVVRYFSQVQVEVDFLIGVCARIDAFLGYKVKESSGVFRLSGFLILRGPRTYADDLSRLFVNFLVLSVRPLLVSVMLDSKFFTLVGDHPFSDIRRRLFDDAVDVMLG